MKRLPPKNRSVNKIKNTLLVDGNSLYKRGFIGARNEYNSKGEHIGGTYQFITVLRKLLNDNFEFSDFYIVHEVENKMNCWINLIGIESPGLTSSLSIAKMVNDIISDWE